MHPAWHASDLVLFAKKGGGQASPEEVMFCFAFLAVIGLIALVSVLARGPATLFVRVRNGLPYCPKCNRQVSYRRNDCRACGFTFRVYGYESPAETSLPSPVVPVKPLRHIGPWEQLYDDPTTFGAIYNLCIQTQQYLDRSLLGSKVTDIDLYTKSVTVTRKRLHYSTVVELFVSREMERHGFVVKVPSHEFTIRITCLKSDDYLSPWGPLLVNLCKIDRSIIASRRSKAQPLGCVPDPTPIPGLRVEVLKRPGQKSLPPP